MSAGITYPTQEFATVREMYSVKTGYRLAGGFNLVVDNLEANTYIPELCPLRIDFARRTATVVNNIKIVEDVEKAATAVKIAKYSFVKAGQSFADDAGNFITVSAINKTNNAYDTLTVAPTAVAITADVKMSQCTVADNTATVILTANYLNYDRRKIEAGATITALGQAYEIEEDNLFIPVTNADKESLTARFMFN